MAKKLSAEIMILATVLLVALAGVYHSSNAGGTVMVIEGSAQTSFVRPLGSLQQNAGMPMRYQCSTNAEGTIECCYPDGAVLRCMQGGGTFGAPRNMIEGGEKQYFVSPTRGYLLG